MSVIRLPSFGFCCFFPWWDAWVVSPYHSCHKVLSVSLIARLHERGKETMTGRERMKDRTQRMIKITAVATCMYTCMSGHGRCLAALTRAYQTRPRVWHALILCSLSLRTNVLRYPLIAQEEIKLLQRIWRVFFSSPCSLMACCYLCRWTQTLPANNFSDELPLPANNFSDELALPANNFD